MQPEGLWQRRWVLQAYSVPHPRPEITLCGLLPSKWGFSFSSIPRAPRKEYDGLKGKDMYTTKERQEKCILRAGQARPPLLPPLSRPLLRPPPSQGRQVDHSPDLGLPKEGQDCGGCWVVLKSILMEGAGGCFRPHAFSTLSHIALLWGCQALHLTKR